MIHPSYTEIMKVVNSEVEPGEEPVVNSRYSIVLATAKRARQLIDGAPALCEGPCNKPLSIAVRMAVQYAYRVKKNTSISCIVYGQIDRPGSDRSTWRAYVYDETALVQLDEVVRMLADRNVQDPKGTIDAILNL